MKPFFKELFEYNHYFNVKLIEEIRSNEAAIPEFTQKVFSHLLDAHHIWNARIKNFAPVFAIWQLQPVGDLLTIEDENYQQSLEIIDGYDLGGEIQYANSKGQAFKNTVRDILFHLINHSNYHKGQIARDFRQNGLEPLKTDYIFYKRG